MRRHATLARNARETEWFWAELAVLRERWNPARHPFHERWCAGRLTTEELGLFAEEYDHLVLAVAATSARVAERVGGSLAVDLHAVALGWEVRIASWRRFASAAGWHPSQTWYYAAEPLATTVACARAWGGDASRSLAEDVLTVHLVAGRESQTASAQLQALLRHYGFTLGRGTEYFRTEAADDAVAQAAVESVLSVDLLALLGHADDVLRAGWQMLDGLERRRP